MFFSEHRLKMTSLRIGKHRIVKNIASLRKVNIAHPYCQTRKVGGRFYLWFPTALAKDLTWEVLILINLARLSISINWKAC